MFYKIGVLNFGKFLRKTPVLKYLYDIVAGVQASNFLKKRLCCRCFPVKFTKFSKKTFFYRTSPVAASEVFCEDFVDSSCENALFRALEQCIWLELPML